VAPTAYYTWQGLTLAVQDAQPPLATHLEALLQDLSWVRTAPEGEHPAVSLTVHRDDHRPHVPPTAREVWRAEGFCGLADGDACYLTDGASLVHMQGDEGCGEAWLAASFAAIPPYRQRAVWAFGLLKLLRPLGYFSLHAAGVVSRQGRGLLLVGPPGSGKSTLTLGLLRQGWGVLSDDAVLLRVQPDGVEALACRRPVYVHAEAAARHADLPFGEAVPDGTGGWKRRVAIETAFPTQQRTSCRPQGLLFASVVPQPQSALHPVAGPTAVQQLLTHSGPHLFDRATMRPHLEILQRLLQQTRVYALDAGRDLYEAPRTLTRLLREAEGVMLWPDW
jgi:hypothetical protein